MRRGTTTAEFAMLLPVLLAAIFGVVDWSWYLYESLGVTTAAQRGVRIAAGVATADQPTVMAAQATRAALTARGLDGVGADVSSTIESRPAGPIVMVEIELPFEPIVGLAATPTVMRTRATASWYGDFGS
jgi:Flp pilus assembly protein TadG